MKKLSIGTWAYCIGPYQDNPVDIDTIISKLAALGFDGLELGGFPPHPNPDDYPEKHQRQQLLDKVKGAGLGFSGLAANLWGEKLINTDDQTKYIEEFTKNCKFCQDLEIPGIRVDTVQPPTIFEEVDYDTAFQRVTKTWNQCSDIAADHGLYVAWEFEPGFAFNKPSDILKILDAVDKKNFGVMYDTCHAQMVGVVGARQPGEKETFSNQLELLDKLKGRLTHVHLIDSDDTCHKDADGNDETSAHPPFGDGHLNFDEILPKLAAEDVGHDWWTIDLCFWSNAWDATEKCFKFLDEKRKQYT